MSFLVYTLSDPRTGAVRYVGKTGRSLKLRLKEHMLPKRLVQHTHKNCWLKQLGGLGLRPIIEEVERCDTEPEIYDAEIFYVAYFRSLGFDLTNGTAGGEGLTGIKRPERSKAWRKRLGAAHRGKTISQEQREKLSQVLRGKPKRPFTAEHRANIAKVARHRGVR
jgi:hypothetical protein